MPSRTERKLRDVSQMSKGRTIIFLEGVGVEGLRNSEKKLFAELKSSIGNVCKPAKEKLIVCKQ